MKYFKYGFGLGFIIVFLNPWSFEPIYLCGESCNSWVNMTKRFYGFSDTFPFNWVVPLAFMVTLGLLTVLFRYVFLKITGRHKLTTVASNVENSLDRILVSCLLVVVLCIMITKFFIMPTPDRLPAAPGIFEASSTIAR